MASDVFVKHKPWPFSSLFQSVFSSILGLFSTFLPHTHKRKNIYIYRERERERERDPDNAHPK